MTDTSYIFLWKGRLLFVGNSINTKVHRHHAVQIGISGDRPFRMKVGGNRWKDHQAIIVASNRDHECIAAMRSVIFISNDPESPGGRQLTEAYLRGRAFNSLDAGKASRYVKGLKTLLRESADRRDVTVLTDRFIGGLIPSVRVADGGIDHRVEGAAAIIQDSLDEAMSVKELSRRVSLSEGRLSHLFKEQMGLPVRKYRLWLKMNLAIEAIVNNSNLTDSAHLAGFADSAHFSRTFSRMFGISPAKILQNSRIVQAYNCSR